MGASALVGRAVDALGPQVDRVWCDSRSVNVEVEVWSCFLAPEEAWLAERGHFDCGNSLSRLEGQEGDSEGHSREGCTNPKADVPLAILHHPE